MDTVQKTAAGSQQRILEFDLASELHHGMLVSNLAYAVAEEMGLPHEQCYELAIAGMLHDIGKLRRCFLYLCIAVLKIRGSIFHFIYVHLGQFF